MSNRKRILIIRPDRVGDVVLTTPLIREVKNSYPDLFLGVMVHSTTAPLLLHNPHIDLVLTDNPSEAGGFWKGVKRLRALEFTTALLPFPTERHAWMTLLAGIPRRIGVGHKLYEVLTFMGSVSRNNYSPPRHEADYTLDLGRKIGATVRNAAPELFLADEEKNSAGRLLKEHGIRSGRPIIGINPGALHSSPNWKPERYAALAEMLLQEYQVLINVGPQEMGLKPVFAPLEKHGALVLSPGLRDLAAICSQLDLLVASSTGTLHIAAALGIPTVSLFCPLTACAPERWAPRGNLSSVLLASWDYCQARCPKNPKICPLEEISVEAVFNEVGKVLKTGTQSHAVSREDT